MIDPRTLQDLRPRGITKDGPLAALPKPADDAFLLLDDDVRRARANQCIGNRAAHAADGLVTAGTHSVQRR